MFAVDHEMGYAGVKAVPLSAGKAASSWASSSWRPGAGGRARGRRTRTAADRGRERGGREAPRAAGARQLGLIGCGWQAGARSPRSGRRCRGSSRSSPTAAPRRGCTPSVPAGAEAGESHRDPGEQDIVVTATGSPRPVLVGSGFGRARSCAPWARTDRRARELDNVVLERAAFICCDSLEKAKLEAGDLIEPVAGGVLDWLEVHELQEVVAGTCRPSDGSRHRRSSSRTGSPRGTWRSVLRWSSAHESAASGGSSEATPRSRGARRRSVLADRLDHLGAVEQAGALLGAEAVLDVAVLEDLGQVASSIVLADDVCRDPFLGGRALKQEREEVPERHRGQLYPPFMRRNPSEGRCAERLLRGVDDTGREERVVIWVERKDGGVWAVGRAVNPSIGRATRRAGTIICSRATSSSMLSRLRTARSRMTPACSRTTARPKA